MAKNSNTGQGISAKGERGYRARLSYKGVNYEKSVRTKEQGKRWRAQMLVDLEKCPDGIKSVRNSWVASVDSSSGEISKTFTNIDSAITWLNKTQSEVALGIYKSDAQKKLTLSEYIPVWRKSKVRASDRTMMRYDTSLDNQILTHLGSERLDGITPQMVRAWVGDMVRDGVGSSSVKKAHALLRHIMKTAFEDEIIRRNPVQRIELPSVVPTEKRALTVRELGLLEDACPDHRAFILVMGLMGLRIGEARALQVQDVNLFKKEVIVRRALTHDKDYKSFSSTTKTKQVRSIPIPAPLIELLKPLVDGQKAKSPVFRGAKGDAINDGWFRKAVFKKATQELGWTDITIHSLRHTCASLMISAGTPVTTVSRVLGHSTVIQTLNTYGHFYKEDVETSMELLGRTYESGRGSGGDLHIAKLA
jgi:integrase